ncbi:MAG: hypothetical protein M0P69_15060 [Bacteroidales bacterium]|jgi:hypothetical protein|nr:hypothetical protein [Bacteroidales bacterium]
MISLEKAKALKEAVVAYNKSELNAFYRIRDQFDNMIDEPYIVHLVASHHARDEIGEWFTFVPRLDQLLAEIEARGYVWAVEVGACEAKAVTMYAVSISINLYWVSPKEFRADSPEDAAADALLWIIEKGGGDLNNVCIPKENTCLSLRLKHGTEGRGMVLGCVRR